jgi:Ni/Co efflux regulator RcnB
MNRHFSFPLRLGALALIALFSAAPALAEKPSWAGDKDEKPRKKDDRRHDPRHGDERRDDRSGSVEFRFDDRNRHIINDYYGTQFRSGKCPPGLAKKHNGCMPPGQAKKWRQGYPLPADLRYYDLPHDLIVRLPPPPRGHKYVRVAGDVLLIAIGTSMVLDAIEDIGR